MWPHKNARSECLFNGLDEPDELAPGAGDGEELYYDEEQEAWVGDDGDWAQTPAGGKVQSGGQIKPSSAQVTGDPGAFTGARASREWRATGTRIRLTTSTGVA